MANSVIDKAIQQLFTDGAKTVELWKNASPDSDFPAQTIPMPAGYDMAAITGSDYATGLIVLKKGMAGSLMRIGAIDAATAFWAAQRYITWNNSGLVFDPSYVKYANSATPPSANGAYCKPMFILGIKILTGGGSKLISRLRSLFSFRERRCAVCL